MDEEFLKNNFRDMCEHMRQFKRREKRKEKIIKEYVSNFEAAYKKAKEIGFSELPHTSYHIYQLLEDSKMKI